MALSLVVFIVASPGSKLPKARWPFKPLMNVQLVDPYGATMVLAVCRSELAGGQSLSDDCRTDPSAELAEWQPLDG
jgi:hypothetical protein